MGRKVGSIKIEINKFPPFSPKVKAAPIVEMKLKAGVDNSITKQINMEWYIVIPRGKLIKGIKVIIGKLVVIQ